VNSHSVSIPAAAVGKVIGRGGATIRSLEEKYSSKVTVPKVAPGTTGSVLVSVSGDNKNAVAAAIAEIGSLAAASDAPRAPREARPERAATVKDTVTVPQANVGRIIGKGGQTIKDLQYSTGCRINVPSPDAADPSHVHVSVSGPSREAVDDAIHKINALVASAASSGGGMGAPRTPVSYAHTAHVDIPAGSVGKVIGRAGATIQDLQSRFDVSIKVPKSSGGEFVTVAVGGADEGAVADAVAAINQLVAPADE